MVGQGQGRDEVIAALVYRTDVFLGGVPAVKDEGDRALAELMVTVDQEGVKTLFSRQETT